MAVTIDLEIRESGESMAGIERLEEGLAASRDTLREINEEAVRNGYVLREFTGELLSLEQQAARHRDAMTKESFEKWIGHAAAANEWTRRAFTTTFASVGQGIANELVDGTNDWQRALRGVLKQMIAVTAQMVIMRSLMTLLTAGTAGWLGFLHGGGKAMHAGGPVRAHSGLELADDEVPIVAQRGEFILRRRAVEEIGSETVEQMNRGIAPAASNPTFNISVSVQGPADAQSLARLLGPEIVWYLRQESERGVKF